VTPVATKPAPIVRRLERFDAVGSTNDVVRGWLAAGESEICVAVAAEQTAGRGRSGRSWLAPPGRGLLLSAGFRPTCQAPDRVWRLAATMSLAMADAAEEIAGLPTGTIRLKWPNDLVVESGIESGGGPGAEPGIRKLGGVLGETDGLGTNDPRAIVGIGLNADWPATEFPTDLRETMTSLRAVSDDRPIDLAALLDRFLLSLSNRVEALHDDRFDNDGWAMRQITTDRRIELQMPDGSVQGVVATGVDALSGALRVADTGGHDGERSIVVGEIVHVRLAGL
jgi:BirA family biotin operon repressor/biotin-[acetyl-CoA-carboxylase] ligase